jgi:hypothetical protein
MNSAIELHDSEIRAITQVAGTVIVRFSPAYIHRSYARPGIDRGSGWIQDIDVVIPDAVVHAQFPEVPRTLDGGSLLVDGDYFENMIPLPLDRCGAVRLMALSLYGEPLIIVGTGAKAMPIGEARYVEEFS